MAKDDATPGNRESVEDVKHREVRELAAIPPEEPEALLGQALKDQVELKRRYGKWMLAAMLGQLLVADGIFVAIAWAGYSWAVSSSVIHVWLVATFVQVVSVVAIIVHSLFSGADVEAAAALASKTDDG